ncbi:hypothetical protein GCM10027271_43400 [Saccharopolyspora gloriosae]|uniref:Outer membrane channel protein CpnT-like N-terminal domain-containing protein n=1 Tax=Saccharopolyspora gloriosae TaxID=455344 RepID=A0A840NH60_9PSEU|nr:hypothetical protein [Saccharopolyspora gloriosae]MBB5070361.1 hypothetical protein [Saccharopolyspora gloriosae]
MPTELPAGLQKALEIVGGQPWPEGDEAGLERIAGAWESLIGAIDETAAALRKSVHGLQEHMRGEFAESYGDHVRGTLLPTLDGLRETARGLADQAQNTAADIQYARIMIVVQLVMLAATIALAWIPGIGQALVAAAASVARVVIGRVLSQVLANIIARAGTTVAGRVALNAASGAVVNEVVELSLDATVQGLQLATGKRTDWNEQFTKGAAISGAVGGAAAGAAGSLVHELTRIGGAALKKSASAPGAGGGLGRDAVRGMDRFADSRAGKEANRALGAGAQGAAALAGDAAANAAGGMQGVGAYTFTSAALESLAGGRGRGRGGAGAYGPVQAAPDVGDAIGGLDSVTTESTGPDLPSAESAARGDTTASDAAAGGDPVRTVSRDAVPESGPERADGVAETRPRAAPDPRLSTVESNSSSAARSTSGAEAIADAVPATRRSDDDSGTAPAPASTTGSDAPRGRSEAEGISSSGARSAEPSQERREESTPATPRERAAALHRESPAQDSAIEDHRNTGFPENTAQNFTAGQRETPVEHRASESARQFAAAERAETATEQTPRDPRSESAEPARGTGHPHPAESGAAQGRNATAGDDTASPSRTSTSAESAPDASARQDSPTADTTTEPAPRVAPQEPAGIAPHDPATADGARHDDTASPQRAVGESARSETAFARPASDSVSSDSTDVLAGEHSRTAPVPHSPVDRAAPSELSSAQDGDAPSAAARARGDSASPPVAPREAAPEAEIAATTATERAPHEQDDTAPAEPRQRDVERAEPHDRETPQEQHRDHRIAPAQPDGTDRSVIQHATDHSDPGSRSETGQREPTIQNETRPPESTIHSITARPEPGARSETDQPGFRQRGDTAQVARDSAERVAPPEQRVGQEGTRSAEPSAVPATTPLPNHSVATHSAPSSAPTTASPSGTASTPGITSAPGTPRDAHTRPATSSDPSGPAGNATRRPVTTSATAETGAAPPDRRPDAPAPPPRAHLRQERAAEPAPRAHEDSAPPAREHAPRSGLPTVPERAHLSDADGIPLRELPTRSRGAELDPASEPDRAPLAATRLQEGSGDVVLDIDGTAPREGPVTERTQRVHDLVRHNAVIADAIDGTALRADARAALHRAEVPAARVDRLLDGLSDIALKDDFKVLTQEGLRLRTGQGADAVEVHVRLRPGDDTSDGASPEPTSGKQDFAHGTDSVAGGAYGKAAGDKQSGPRRDGGFNHFLSLPPPTGTSNPHRTIDPSFGFRGATPQPSWAHGDTTELEHSASYTPPNTWSGSTHDLVHDLVVRRPDRTTASSGTQPGGAKLTMPEVLVQVDAAEAKSAGGPRATFVRGDQGLFDVLSDLVGGHPRWTAATGAVNSPVRNDLLELTGSKSLSHLGNDVLDGSTLTKALEMHDDAGRRRTAQVEIRFRQGGARGFTTPPRPEPATSEAGSQRPGTSAGTSPAERSDPGSSELRPPPDSEEAARSVPATAETSASDETSGSAETARKSGKDAEPDDEPKPTMLTEQGRGYKNEASHTAGSAQPFNVNAGLGLGFTWSLFDKPGTAQPSYTHGDRLDLRLDGRAFRSSGTDRSTVRTVENTAATTWFGSGRLHGVVGDLTYDVTVRFDDGQVRHAGHHVPEGATTWSLAEPDAPDKPADDPGHLAEDNTAPFAPHRVIGAAETHFPNADGLRTALRDRLPAAVLRDDAGTAGNVRASDNEVALRYFTSPRGLLSHSPELNGDGMSFLLNRGTHAGTGTPDDFVRVVIRAVPREGSAVEAGTARASAAGSSPDARDTADASTTDSDDSGSTRPVGLAGSADGVVPPSSAQRRYTPETDRSREGSGWEDTTLRGELQEKGRIDHSETVRGATTAGGGSGVRAGIGSERINRTLEFTAGYNRSFGGEQRTVDSSSGQGRGFGWSGKKFTAHQRPIDYEISLRDNGIVERFTVDGGAATTYRSGRTALTEPATDGNSEYRAVDHDAPARPDGWAPGSLPDHFAVHGLDLPAGRADRLSGELLGEHPDGAQVAEQQVHVFAGEDKVAVNLDRATTGTYTTPVHRYAEGEWLGFRNRLGDAAMHVALSNPRVSGPPTKMTLTFIGKSTGSTGHGSERGRTDYTFGNGRMSVAPIKQFYLLPQPGYGYARNDSEGGSVKQEHEHTTTTTYDGPAYLVTYDTTTLLSGRDVVHTGVGPYDGRGVGEWRHAQADRRDSVQVWVPAREIDQVGLPPGWDDGHDRADAEPRTSGERAPASDRAGEGDDASRGTAEERPVPRLVLDGHASPSVRPEVTERLVSQIKDSLLRVPPAEVPQAALARFTRFLTSGIADAAGRVVHGSGQRVAAEDLARQVLGDVSPRGLATLLPDLVGLGKEWSTSVDGPLGSTRLSLLLRARLGEGRFTGTDEGWSDNHQSKATTTTSAVVSSSRSHNGNFSLRTPIYTDAQIARSVGAGAMTTGSLADTRKRTEESVTERTTSQFTSGDIAWFSHPIELELEVRRTAHANHAARALTGGLVDNIMPGADVRHPRVDAIPDAVHSYHPAGESAPGDREAQPVTGFPDAHYSRAGGGSIAGVVRDVLDGVPAGEHTGQAPPAVPPEATSARQAINTGASPSALSAHLPDALGDTGYRLDGLDHDARYRTAFGQRHPLRSLTFHVRLEQARVTPAGYTPLEGLEINKTEVSKSSVNDERTSGPMWNTLMASAPLTLFPRPTAGSSFEPGTALTEMGEVRGSGPALSWQRTDTAALNGKKTEDIELSDGEIYLVEARARWTITPGYRGEVPSEWTAPRTARDAVHVRTDENGLRAMGLEPPPKTEDDSDAESDVFFDAVSDFGEDVFHDAPTDPAPPGDEPTSELAHFLTPSRENR